MDMGTFVLNTINAMSVEDLNLILRALGELIVKTTDRVYNCIAERNALNQANIQAPPVLVWLTNLLQCVEETLPL